MRRRRFIAGLGSAGGAALVGTGASGKEAPRDPVENADTGETYGSISQAVDDAAPGHTLRVELGATFEEDLTVATEDLTLEATGDSRLRIGPETDVRAHETMGNERPTVDGGVDVLLLDARGNSRPVVEGDVDVLVLEARGNAEPTVHGDVGVLLLESRGNAKPVIDGDVDELVLDARGRAEPEIGGDVGERADGTVDSQPTIEGEVEIRANGVTVDGFDVAAGTVGIDVLADDPDTVKLSNTAVSGARGAADDDFPPEGGIGVRITTGTTSEPVTIGGEEGWNVLKDNAVGVMVVDQDGDVADVDSQPLLENNVFVGNGASVVPEPGDPREEPDPIVSPGPPVEVLTSERGPGATITADLPNVAVDEGGTIGMLSTTVRLDSGGTIEFTFDPERQVDDPALVEGYEAVADGAFAIETPLDEDEIEAVRFTFAVERDVLDDPELFSVHRRVDGVFEPLRTELVGETPSTYQYAVFAPGFSIFQATEFDVGGIGGAGRETHGELLLPEDDPVDSTFVRVETTTDIDDLELEAENEDVTIDDSILIDFEDFPEEELPASFATFSVTNAGEEPATVRTSAGLSRATFLNVPLDVDIDDIDPFESWLAVLDEYLDVVTDPIELDPGQTVTLALTLASIDPDNQLWITFGVPTLVNENTNEPHLGSDVGFDADGPYANCSNDADAPVMFHRDYEFGESLVDKFPFIGGPADWVPDEADLDNPHLRVPAYLTVNWDGEPPDRDDESIAVVIEFNDGPDGSLLGIYDKNGVVDEEGQFHSNPVAVSYSGEDFADGAETVEFDLIFESENDCNFEDLSDQIVTDSVVLDDVGDLEFEVLFDGTENRWAEIAGEDEVSATAAYYTMGQSTTEISGELLEEAFQIFTEGVLSAALPGPVQTYRAARAAAGAGAGNPERVAIWSGIDGLTETPLTPQSLLAKRISSGITGFSGGNHEDVPPIIDAQGLDLGLYGPTIYVSDASDPDCVDPDVRTLSVEGQVTGGPVVLMGLDSEQGAGNRSHGPPDDHAALVEAILGEVTNDGEGVLVLGASYGDATRFWRHDVAPRIDAEVTIVDGPDAIGDVDFEGYAMVAVASSDGQVHNRWDGASLTNAENQALIDRRGDLATFINGGGGLLGKTQHGLNDPWEYISPVVDIESVHASNSSIIVTDAGKEIGLTQDGMDGWCCYHEAFEEESVPDFLDVLLRNPERAGNPPAAIGGGRVVVETAVQLEITGPANVQAGRPTEFEFSLENAAGEAGDDVKLDVEFTRIDEIAASDVELVDGGDLELDGEALTGTLTEDPIPFPPDLDEEFTREVVFADTGAYFVEVDVVVADSGETVVRLPFGVWSVSEQRGICEE